MRLACAFLVGATLLVNIASVVCQSSSSAGMDPRVAKFSALASKNKGVVPLTTALYDEIIAPTVPGTAGRVGATSNYSVSVILTALNKKFGCAPCQAFDGEHRAVAGQNWAKSIKKKDAVPHFFAVLDFEAGQEVFRRMGLNTAPLGQLFVPGKPQAIQYDFNRNGPSPEAFASFLAQNTGQPITFKRPVDYTKLVSTVSVLAAVATGSFFFWPYVRFFLTSRWLWATLTIVFILPMNAGYMWNQIRKPPFMSVTREGQVSYIAGGYSNQYGVETQIISAIYGVLAFATYTLAVTLPNFDQDKNRQRLGVYLWVGVLIVLASLLVSIFAIKNPGYPFRLLF